LVALGECFVFLGASYTCLWPPSTLLCPARLQSHIEENNAASVKRSARQFPAMKTVKSSHGLLDLPDELLVDICRHALIAERGLIFKRAVFSQRKNRAIAVTVRKNVGFGLLFVNRRLSRIALPIVYGENVFYFKTMLKPTLEFLNSLSVENRRLIKKVAMEDPLPPLDYWEAGSSQDSVLAARVCLIEEMRLESLSLPILPPTNRSFREHTEPPTHHENLLLNVLPALRDGGLEEFRFLHRYIYHRSPFDFKANMFGNERSTDLAERVLLDMNTQRSLMYLSIAFTAQYGRNPDKAYQAMCDDLIPEALEVWKCAGFEVEWEERYLEMPITSVVIRRREKETK
jgi:hypothetical protein